MIIQHPNDIKWTDEPLPNVHSVDKNIWVLAWFEYNDQMARIEMIHPWEDELNPLRWTDMGGFPIGAPVDSKGNSLKLKYWAYLTT